ncbi:hypothetical protein F5I97DRAFT_1910854 [Phlebopus sp. FC_14]|nr:hypothetical protein F5I97DRAFT_1910854 [Phlebopus sp. FC_14]
MSTVQLAPRGSIFPATSPNSQHDSPSHLTLYNSPMLDPVVRCSASQDDDPAAPRPLSYHHPPITRSSERPYTSHGTPNLPLTTSISGPYTSASARTSYTRVDVDSAPPTVYPVLPLPSIPTGSAELNTNGMVDHVNAVPHESAEPPIPQISQVSLTFLLVSGQRKSQSFDPETTVGRVKELVWNAWPARDPDWQDERPPAPSYLRILYLGKILQDDDTLIRLGFPTSLPSSPATTPTIVHLSIRPYVPPSKDFALSKKKRLSTVFGRRDATIEGDEAAEDGVERTGCCGGCIVC